MLEMEVKLLSSQQNYQDKISSKVYIYHIQSQFITEGEKNNLQTKLEIPVIEEELWTKNHLNGHAILTLL